MAEVKVKEVKVKLTVSTTYKGVDHNKGDELTVTEAQAVTMLKHAFIEEYI